MSRLTDHAVGTLDIGYVIKPKQKELKSKKFIVVKSKKKKNNNENEIQEDDLAYYFLIYACLSKQKNKFKRYLFEYKKVDDALTAYRMIITNPKVGENYIKEKENVRKMLDQTIVTLEDSKLLHMSIQNALKTSSFKDHNEDSVSTERKVFKDEMQVVMPGLYISGWKPASNKNYLKENKITHIVCCVDTQNAKRFPNDFQYLIIKADDNVNQDMKQFFQKSNEFIREALKKPGKILIHCGAGISRSTTILCAYLINEFQMKTKQAMELCKNARPFCQPNNGFIQQLKEYEKHDKINKDKIKEGKDFVTRNNKVLSRNEEMLRKLSIH
jgi:protein-tyrosine phosphatase